MAQLLLKVLDDVEAINGHAEGLAKHFLGGIDVAVPHVCGYFLQLCQQSILVVTQVLNNQVFVASLQNVQDPLVGMIDEYGCELPVLFFRDSSSIPRLLIGLKVAASENGEEPEKNQWYRPGP